MPKETKALPVIRKTDVAPIYAAPDQGLTADQAKLRLDKGWGNTPVEPPTKTTKQIVLGNLLTYFNAIFFILGLCIVLVGEFQELMFLGIIACNILIGIFQELNAKRTLDKLTFLAAPKGTVIRDGQESVINTDQMVRDDIVIFGPGNQIYADAVVVDGEIQVNESLITGEADEITKRTGDNLLSGSFVLSGTCRARLEHVGADAYVSKLSLEAKKEGKEPESVMMRSLNRLVKVVGILLIPIGILLFLNQTRILERTIAQGTVSTVTALQGMIPEGLYLLTTVALAVSMMHLASKRVLVHQMRCIETLARVDVLCVDKTGTITENKMTVKDVVLLCEDRFVEEDIRMIMSDYVGNMGADNETMVAMKKYFKGAVMQTAVSTLPFSSARKYGGVSYAEDETYLLGAPEFILGEQYSDYQDVIEEYSAMGCRVLLLALYDGDLNEPGIHGDIMPLSLILLTNKIRKEAPDTFRYFAEQGVQVKVISGDNPVTVSQVALDAGITGAEQYVDAITLDTPQKIYEAAGKYTVFGRVKPEQKRQLVKALKTQGHTVAMTGDGVNDVLALKDADCSIAMASGSDVACNVSQLVLLNSNFASMPSVVDEGRRVINNIERSASLFLVKNIFSLFLSLITLIATLPYPITPSQLSLVSGLTIGIPGFILALEPNFSRIEGHFMRNVIFRAIPAALTNVILVSGVIVFSLVFGLTDEEMGTMSTIILSTVGVLMIYKVSQPFNRLRRLLFGGVIVALIFSVLFLQGLFSLSPLGLEAGMILAVFMGLTYPVMWGIHGLMEKASVKWKELRSAWQSRH